MYGDDFSYFYHIFEGGVAEGFVLVQSASEMLPLLLMKRRKEEIFAIIICKVGQGKQG